MTHSCISLLIVSAGFKNGMELLIYLILLPTPIDREGRGETLLSGLCIAEVKEPGFDVVRRKKWDCGFPAEFTITEPKATLGMSPQCPPVPALCGIVVPAGLGRPLGGQMGYFTCREGAASRRALVAVQSSKGYVHWCVEKKQKMPALPTCPSCRCDRSIPLMAAWQQPLCASCGAHAALNPPLSANL